MRNFKEIELLQDELSAIVRRNNLHESKKVIYDLYETATDEPHSFLYIDLLQKDPNRMFLKNFTQYLRIRYLKDRHLYSIMEENRNKPKDYKNGKIYSVRNTVNDDIYISSTTQPLSKRF